MAKPRVKVETELGLKAALAEVRRIADRPLFVPPTRRYVPLRHAALGNLLGGVRHPGLPTGCFIEVIGKEHSGKSTLACTLADAVINQPEGTMQTIHTSSGVKEIPAPRRVLYLDYEYALDREYTLAQIRNCVMAETDEDTGKVINADEANLFVMQPHTLDEGIDVAIRFVQSGEFGLIVIDSVPAMLTDSEQQKSMKENTMAELARGMGKMFRKSTGPVSRFGVSFLLINQWRDKVGLVFGDPRTTPGGKAAGYFTSLRLDVSGSHKTPWFPDGKLANIKAIKNKITGLRHACTYHLGAGVGLSAEVELIERALACGLIHAERGGRYHLLPKWSTRGPKRVVASKKLFPDAKSLIGLLRRNGRLFEQLSERCTKIMPHLTHTDPTSRKVSFDE